MEKRVSHHLHLDQNQTRNQSTQDTSLWDYEPSKLVQAIVDSHQRGAPEGLITLLSEMNAPWLDSATTVMSTRAALLGARRGRAFYTHETRRRIPMPPALESEVPVWAHGTIPVWNQGVLTEPKYFSFFQDAPLPAFNPNHRRKWRPHELLHGAQALFWHPEMTPFEAYIGARLHEMLPVVHWYGFDEILRPRCPKHIGHMLRRHHCPDCEEVAKPYWASDTEQDPRYLEHAVKFAAHALEHGRTEYDACLREIESGQIVSVPRLGLDSSSDTMGYIKGHWARLTAWSFGVWMELFHTEGEDVFGNILDYAHHIKGVANDLVSGSIEVSLDDFIQRRSRRVLQDLGYRVLLLLEWFEEEDRVGRDLERVLMPLLEEAGDHTQQLLFSSFPDQTQQYVQEILRVLGSHHKRLPRELQDTVPALGHAWVGANLNVDGAVQQVKEGLSQIAPVSLVYVEDERLCAFLASESFSKAGFLAHRWADWLVEEDPKAASVAKFEAWMAPSSTSDQEAELFGVIPADWADFKGREGVLRPNQSFQMGLFDAWAIEQVAPDLSEGTSGAVSLMSSWFRGSLRMGICTEQMQELLSLLEHQGVESLKEEQWPLIEGLLWDGLWVWLPRPR